MTYGLYVENNYSYSQIDSDTYDEGFRVKELTGNTSSISASVFRPNDGDLLFIRRLDDAANYYVYVKPVSGSYQLRRLNGGMEPQLPSATVDGGAASVQAMVVSRQGQSNYSGDYGLQVLKPDQTVAFDSRSYTNARFQVNTIYSENSIGTGSRPYPNAGRNGVKFHTGSNREWVLMNGCVYKSYENTLRMISAVRVGTSGFYLWGYVSTGNNMIGNALLPNVNVMLMASGD